MMCLDMLGRLKYHIEQIENNYNIPKEKRFTNIEFVKYYPDLIFDSVLKADDITIELSDEQKTLAIMGTSHDMPEYLMFIRIILRIMDKLISNNQDENIVFNNSLQERLISYKKKKIL